MAGHSKWSKIKRGKGIQDAKKALVFTKFTKEIMHVTQQWGSDPEANYRLRLAMQNAKAAGMPKENIIRAIKKGSGALSKAAYIRKRYEGYGPYGIAVFVDAMTDNIKRTVAHVRACLHKYGGNLDKQGAIQHLFKQEGIFLVRVEAEQDWDMLALELIEEGVSEIKQQGDYMCLTCEAKDFTQLQKALERENSLPDEAYLAYVPYHKKSLGPEETARVKKLLEALEALEDVQEVYHDLAF